MKDRKRCHKHNMRRWRKRNRMKAAYYALKYHARDRGIQFKISFGQFRRFAIRSDYLNRTGLGGHCLTVDRKNNLKGYTPRNIQPLTREQNSIKYMRRDEIRAKAGMRWQEAA